MTGLASRQYWDDTYTTAGVDDGLFRGRGPGHTVNRRIDTELRALTRQLPSGAAAIEIGCGGSDWLPHLSLAHNLSVTGVDYSERGCELAQKKAERAGAAAEVVHADLFSPPERLLGGFDLVVSFGVVEHFSDTAGALRPIGAFASPGGYVFTLVPHLRGTLGALQRRFSRRIYDVHKPLSVEDLRRAHEDAGLEVLRCEYFLTFNYGVLQIDAAPSRRLTQLARLALWYALVGLSALVAGRRWIERVVPPNGYTSPYVLCVARRSSRS